MFVKWRCTITLLLLILAACGGGGGGPATPTVAISVSPAKSPVLITYTSNTVGATFPSPAVPDGTQIIFTASSTNITLIPPTATVTGGVATVRVKSSVPGKYRITATGTVGSTVYTGNTAVTFIDQPATVKVYIALQPVVNNLGGLQFTVVNDPGISIFQNFSSYNPGIFVVSDPLPGSAPLNNRINIGALAPNGIDITSTAPLFQLTYAIAVNGGLPGFSVDSASVLAIDANGVTITTPEFLINSKYDTDTF
jgi:hypothetical protein